MKKTVLFFLFLLMAFSVHSENCQVVSPDKKLVVTISVEAGRPFYSITYDGRPMLTRSALGLKTNIGDFTQAMSWRHAKETKVDRKYEMSRTKASSAHYVAHQLDVELANADGYLLTITFSVSNNDVAYRYTLPRGKDDNPRCVVVYSEASSFDFPAQTTTFLCPQISPMTGWERTKPSYEENYVADAPLQSASKFGEGYTFPCLFRVGNDGWVLLGETGVGSNYVASHLSDYHLGVGYTIAFPNSGEMNGAGSPYASIALPGSTSWRTITVGTTLKPIVETTIPYDVVDSLYEAKTEYKPGRYTWSWLIWQDYSIRWDDQVEFIDLAATMGYEYVLVDNWWDKQIGRDKMEELSAYAQSKGVRLLLWYNSNGHWNDAPQTPRDRMHTAYAREQEMAWLEKIGIAGIKVDFFGSDKQQMMALYEDILADANRHGLQVIFHGCTIPRGWERMYPNYVASEAVLASENVVFDERHARAEGFELTMHPFSRNALGAIDWGGIIMNRYMSRDNRSRHPRYTSDTFEMATGIVLQTSVNCVALQPNNLRELPAFELDFLRELPTTWDEVRFLEGYPTKYVVLARRAGNKWYVAGLNGTSEAKTIRLHLPMFAGKTVRYYTDMPKRNGQMVSEAVLKQLKMGKDGSVKVTIQGMGGLILAEQ
ncbi:MAG: glycoside hydrolase family 97 catalytic domain-containing protein [Prevotella sp.]|nr:glycoside hydrolase family 97 catalytic domain-containing protein [Prevotella sp.]